MRLLPKTIGKLYSDILRTCSKQVKDRTHSANNDGIAPQPVIRTVSILNLSNASPRTVDSLENDNTIGISHNREMISAISSVRLIDSFNTIGATVPIVRLEWLVPQVYTIISHGHGFEFLLGQEKIADFFIKANVSISVHVGPATSSSRILPGATTNQSRYNRLTVETNSPNPCISSEINFRDFKFINRNLIGGDEAWSTYKSDVGLNYLLKTSQDATGSKFLAVGFSAIRAVGDFTYNYKSSLETIDVNTLFILDDFGDQGSYYYADHGDLGIFNSVQNLLKDLCSELEVPFSNVITFGSSKGGAGALIHGVALGAGHIYVGAPQTKIGTFVTKPHPNVLELITGDTTADSVEQLDKVLFNMVKEATVLPKTTIIVGNADHHYEKHAIPFKKFAEENGHKVELTVLNGVPHAEIGHKYRRLLHGYISRVLGNHERSSTPNS